MSDVRRENLKLRLDSGYFSKPMLIADSIARGYPKGHDELGALFSRFVKGIFDINADSYVDDGIPFLRILNLRQGVIDESNIAFIPEIIHQDEIKTELRLGDIVLSKTAYPAASLVTLERCNTSQDTIATTLSTYGASNYRAEAIVAYLNSGIGQKLLWRQFQGNVQLHLSLDDGRKVPIPRFSTDLQTKIVSFFQQSDRARQAAIQQLKNAETNLLRALGLENWQAPEPLSYIRSSRDAFAAGRLDAEHFQPKFKTLIAHIESTGRAKYLSSLLRLNQRGKQPDYADTGLPVVNSKHVINGEVHIDSENRKATAANNALLIELGDVLLNGTGVGTIGRAAPYLHDFKAIPDNHVTILRPRKSVDPVYLAVFLNSVAGRLQVEQRLRGSSGQIELYPNDIAQFVVWDAPSAVQDEIRKCAEDSFQQKQRATQLLDAAKRAVEIAIEDSETAALAYCNDALSQYTVP
jgi:type I restriction enzyme S subunit